MTVSKAPVFFTVFKGMVVTLIGKFIFVYYLLAIMQTFFREKVSKNELDILKKLSAGNFCHDNLCAILDVCTERAPIVSWRGMYIPTHVNVKIHVHLPEILLISLFICNCFIVYLFQKFNSYYTI